MILGIEIALTVLGCMFLFRGKGVGKDAVAHPQYRWLGGFCLTVWIAVFGAVILGGIILLVTTPGATPDTLQEKFKWHFIGIEFAIVAVYGVVGALWESSIRKKALAMTQGIPAA
jgi:hypothetical protein